MEPAQTAKNYDQIAPWWREQHAHSKYGVAQLERAIGFSERKGNSLDVGCGSSGRFMSVLEASGFSVEGMDSSAEMLKLAEEELPSGLYFQAEVATDRFEQKYHFISAWDSTFHLPLDLQEPALENMCAALLPRGILVFTCGGASEAGTITGEFRGCEFEYSTLGTDRFLELLREYSCECLHVEWDQGPTESHVYMIARKR